MSILPRTIRHRLLLVTTFCLIVTFSGMGAVVVFGLPQGLLSGVLHRQKHEALARLSAVADNKKGLLTQWFGERLGNLELAGRNPVLAAFLAAKPEDGQDLATGGGEIARRRQDVAVWLRNIRRLYADYDHLELVAEREGTILISTDSGRVGGRSPLPKKNIEEIPIQGEPFAFFVSENKGKTAHLCLAVHLVPVGAATPMALVFHVDTSTLTNKLRDIPLLGASGGILLVDMNQILLTPLGYPLRNGESAIPLQTKMESKMAQFAAWGNDGVMQAPDCRGVPVLGAVRHIRVLPDFGLGMVVKQDQAEVFAPIFRWMITLAAIACSGLALLLLALFFMARTLLKPVEEVTAAACYLRDGDLSARAPETGSGEAQVLAIAFNVMAGEVQRWNETLLTLVEERTAELVTSTRRLEESETRLHAILENSVDAIGVLKNGLHVYANAAYLRTFGYGSWEELSGRFIVDLIAPNHHSEVLDLIALHNSGAASPLSHETRGRRNHNGEIFDLDMRLSTFDLAGELHTLLIFRDITERKLAQDHLVRMYEELQARTRQLEAMNDELESFNHTVSHDLRTPIRALAGFPDLLEAHLGDRLDDKGRQYLMAIREAGRRMAEITTDLLNFSRLGRVDITVTDVDLSLLVHKVREDLSVMAGDRQVEWRVLDLPVVRGDANLLRIALTNLLANALKFTRLKVDAVIRIDSAVGADGIPVFTVSDNGAGFDMKYVDRLFKVFSRLHPNEEFEGIGIGLATVNRIVRRHGGRIWAEGSPGEGASFSFTLAPSPLDAPPPPLSRQGVPMAEEGQ